MRSYVFIINLYCLKITCLEITIQFYQHILIVTRKGLKEVNKPMPIPPAGLSKVPTDFYFCAMLAYTCTEV